VSDPDPRSTEPPETAIVCAEQACPKHEYPVDDCIKCMEAWAGWVLNGRSGE